jgi:CubicO group peptidase (beta-lactamase class C family)
MTNITDQVDALFAQWDTTTSPGCILAVIKDGEFLYQRGYGMADLERGLAISTESIFDIGSTGKQFTATIIAILANRGRLTLDDSIRKHIPELPAYADQITIRHLIHHTSGLRDYLTLLDLRGLPMENLYAEDFLLDLIVRQKGLNFTPGSEYTYSNSGYFLLGTLAQRITGRHITELIKEWILDPLGMKHTTFNKDYRPIVKNRALSYEDGETEGTFVNALALSGGFGDGALLTCVDDLLLWDRNFYDNKLNNAQSDLIEQLHQTGKLNDGKPITYAFGLDVNEYKGQRVVEHGGGWAGYRSEMMRFPDQYMTIICLANLGSMDPSLLCQQVADLMLEDVLKAEKTAQRRKPSHGKTMDFKPEDFVGLYQGRFLTFETFLKDGRLYFTNANREFPLNLIGNKKFQLDVFPVFISFAGSSNENLVIKEGARVTRFKRIDAKRFTAPALSPYAGSYYSNELDIHYFIAEKDGALQFQRTPFDTPKPVHVFARNSLRTSLGEMRLRLNKDGSIKGFELNAGRVTGIKFRKVR